MGNSESKKTFVVIGGGASGFFSAIRMAELIQRKKIAAQVILLESTPNFLQKLKISGGGRCNVTHHQFEIPALVENYPRGKKELRSPFSQFFTLDTVEWFKKRGVKLKTEPDGRMFPVTDSSSTIINCFLKEAEKWGVELHKSQRVSSVVANEEHILVSTNKDLQIKADAIVIATGSSPAGYRLAESLGMKITDLAPSLFSFKIESPLLKDYSGTSFKNVSLELKTEKKVFKQTGPMLITHWGLSGPAILKLSAWAAREMKACSYKAKLVVHWDVGKSLDEVRTELKALFSSNERAKLSNVVPSLFTKAFWRSFIDYLGIAEDRLAGELSKKEFNKLVDAIYATNFEIKGKNRFKDEFVECGGVGLKQIDFKTMSWKKDPRIHVTGELLDIDGITGGFNFQNAWTSGWLSANHIIESITKK
jgi:predicted Rossmann fold flavoprotein